MKVDQSKIRAVLNYPTPVTKKEVCSFLGLTGYYWKFIRQYASIAAIPTDLTRKCSPNKVNWTPACQMAFTKLKELLCAAPHQILVNHLCYRLMLLIEVWVRYLVKWTMRKWNTLWPCGILQPEIVAEGEVCYRGERCTACIWSPSSRPCIWMM